MRGDNIEPWSEGAKARWAEWSGGGTVTCGCWHCTGKAHDDGTIHGTPVWTSSDPLTVDEEPWTWSCPRCTAVLTRDLVVDHVAAHDEHPEAVIAWAFLAGLVWLVAIAAAWLVLRR